MTLNEWKKLSPEEQAKRCRLDVSPYTDMDLFKEIEREYLREYGSEGTLYKVRCCFGPGLGPYNGIFVTLASSQKRTKIPKVFLGFPVEKKFIKNTGYSISFHDLHYLFSVGSRYQLNNLLPNYGLKVSGNAGNWRVVDTNDVQVFMEELFQNIKENAELERQFYNVVMSYAR